MEFYKELKPQTCKELLEGFSKRGYKIFGEKIEFTGVGDRDVYNITAPFEDDGEMVIAGRVEARDSEDSQVIFFVNRDGKWEPRKNTKTFTLQDPFVTKIKGELVFGGVEIFPHPEIEDGLWYRTVFYRGKNINDLEKFTVGPNGMKDIRLVELKNGKVGVFTRPQGEVGGRGKIGFIEIDSIVELSPEIILKAELIEGQFIDEEWGGANEIFLLNNGLLGVLGHIACYDTEGNRHYYPMTFAFNPHTREATKMKIIAVRDNFPQGPAKRPDLIDVIFSGGIRRLENGKAIFYGGVSDAETHKIVIPDPFLEYEKSSS